MGRSRTFLKLLSCPPLEAGDSFHANPVAELPIRARLTSILRLLATNLSKSALLSKHCQDWLNEGLQPWTLSSGDCIMIPVDAHFYVPRA